MSNMILDLSPEVRKELGVELKKKFEDIVAGRSEWEEKRAQWFDLWMHKLLQNQMVDI